MFDSTDGESPSQTRYALVPHTADLAIHVWGDELAALFTNAAEGLFSVMAPAVGIDGERQVEIDAVDYEELLVNWLNELIWLHETDRVSFSGFRITAISPTHLSAVICFGTSSETHMVVKAATFHDLHITKTSRGYETTVVFDV